ncbi:MAG: hypothetical protein A2Z50_06490 [Nitrospirae bacterium RBG_19FT_COMBO_42_15]|nr:MAG: hypothetical protein A2Z50_06490 [Nitrospirae bacterium RBG_19FT_COMBO_42_15]
MIPDSGFPKQRIPEAQPKGKLPIAVLLGLLTFVVTPIITIIIGAPIYFLAKLSDNFNLTVILNIIGFREISGFFAAYFILSGLFALLGDFATAIISWLINNRSKKLAAITFVSALVFQLVLVAIVVPMTIRESQVLTESIIEYEKSFRQFAKIGNASFSVQEPYSDAEIGNRRPEYGPKYKKLRIVVPVSVSHAGVYQVHVRYSFTKDGEWGSTPMKDTTETFDVGEHTVEVEFIADGSHGFWSPAAVNGTAEIKLSYLVPEKEMVDEMKPDLDKEIHEKIMKGKEQLLKSQGLDFKDARAKPTINKFIEGKEVHF